MQVAIVIWKTKRAALNYKQQENGCGQLYLALEPNTPCMFFMRKTTKENKTFLLQLHFFQNMVTEVGEMAKVVNIFFEKSGPLLAS